MKIALQASKLILGTLLITVLLLLMLGVYLVLGMFLIPCDIIAFVLEKKTIMGIMYQTVQAVYPTIFGDFKSLWLAANYGNRYFVSGYYEKPNTEDRDGKFLLIEVRAKDEAEAKARATEIWGYHGNIKGYLCIVKMASEIL